MLWWHAMSPDHSISSVWEMFNFKRSKKKRCNINYIQYHNTKHSNKIQQYRKNVQETKYKAIQCNMECHSMEYRWIYIYIYEYIYIYMYVCEYIYIILYNTCKVKYHFDPRLCWVSTSKAQHSSGSSSSHSALGSIPTLARAESMDLLWRVSSVKTWHS